MGTDTLYSQLGKIIKLARQKKQLSQAELASAVSLSRVSIANIERGHQKFLVHTFWDLMRTLDLKPETIFSEIIKESKKISKSEMPENIPRNHQILYQKFLTS